MTFVGVLSIVGVAIVVLVYFVYQTWIVERRQITLDSQLGGEVTIVQLSDLHGRTRFLNGGISRIVNRMNPDIVCVTGDLTNRLEQLPKVIRELERIHCNHIYFIPGNHEWYEYSLLRKRFYSREQYEETKRKLGLAGIVVLENEYAVVQTNGGRVAISGFDNSFYGNEKPFHIPRSKKTLYSVALGHSPSIVSFLKRNAIDYDLLLAGHTHGGQINLFGWSYGSYRRYHVGLRSIEGKRWFYINRGLGNVHLPIRIGSRPEITAFRISGKQ